MKSPPFQISLEIHIERKAWKDVRPSFPKTKDVLFYDMWCRVTGGLPGSVRATKACVIPGTLGNTLCHQTPSIRPSTWGRGILTRTCPCGWWLNSRAAPVGSSSAVGSDSPPIQRAIHELSAAQRIRSFMFLAEATHPSLSSQRSGPLVLLTHLYSHDAQHHGSVNIVFKTPCIGSLHEAVTRKDLPLNYSFIYNVGILEPHLM